MTVEEISKADEVSTQAIATSESHKAGETQQPNHEEPNSVQLKDEQSNATSLSSESRSRKNKKRRAVDNYLTAPKLIPGGAAVCVSRLPHGFYEPELRSYLSQFGEVTRLRVSRNPRTGASRHYAFVEFRHAEVAKIVIDTMHNYLLAGHLLQCTMIPEEKIHAELWKGANRKFVQVDWRKREATKHNDIMEEKAEDIARFDQERLKKQDEKFKELGIDYDISGVLGGELVL